MSNEADTCRKYVLPRLQQGRTVRPAPTDRQGQFLAYIHHYSLLNGRPPAEADMQRFFQVTPPSVHQMVLTLERRGFIHRVPGQARRITVVVPTESLPSLRHSQSEDRPRAVKLP